MHTLLGLVVAAAAACAIARPLGPTISGVRPEMPAHAPVQPSRRYIGEFLMPRLLMPSYFGFDDTMRPDSSQDDHEWLNKEIDRLNQMEDEEDTVVHYDDELSRWMSQVPDMPQAYEERVQQRELPPAQDILPEPEPSDEIKIKIKIDQGDQRETKRDFALTPFDEGYYEPEEKVITPQSDGPHEGIQSVEISLPRKIRQNPNMGRTRNLVAENLDKLRIGLTHEAPDSTDNPRHSNGLDVANDPADSIYGIAIIAAVGAALSMAIVGFAFGWYSLSKKAKAAADVDYPAYGVTGPTVDSSGDRKLAHSAHMYHYQHQKQQIIAMERIGLEQRNGSVSDPESEEENEEGDYTVYECPGFATTGEMEVKNPLFSEEPTPATPGKCELVKPQPKD